jgi:hypothetical protein
MCEACQALERFVAERRELDITHTPATLQLLHHQLAIE